MIGHGPSYRPRVVDAELARRLRTAGTVLIEGPKACGKTETARQAAASEVLLDTDEGSRRALEIDPDLVLTGPTPRLLDEWQTAPALWNHVRRAVDARGERGQFILTGSAVPADDATRHTGAGRVSRLRMRPMSLFESGHCTAEVSLEALFAGAATRAEEVAIPAAKLAERIVCGGWPGLLDLRPGDAVLAVRDYVEEVCRVDIPRVEGSRRDPPYARRVLRALARNVTTYAAATTVAADASGADRPFDAETVRRYVNSCERLMIVEDQPAWAPHLRSRSILRGSAKRQFVDPSIAAAALRASPSRLLQDIETLGLLFESLAVRDLRIYAQRIDGTVLQYRDNTGLEVDAIVERADGSWAAFEIKLGSGGLDEVAKTLGRFRERVDTRRCGEPVALGIIVGRGYGYVRDDGVHVIPLTALGP